MKFSSILFYGKQWWTDNGGEYTSNQFLQSEGIKHERKTPQQNGVAERLNRTLIEMVRTMLATSKQFWAEALSTAEEHEPQLRV